MKTSRVTKLARRVRSRPCPGCGRHFDPPAARTAGPDLARLGVDEQAELAALIRAITTPPCSRCGHTSHDLTGLSDEQLNRTLKLLRTALGREIPGLNASAWPL